MTTPRRRILRPAQAVALPAPSHRQERWQKQLEADRGAFRRWMAKLKRAVTTLDRLQARIGRLERQLAG